MIGNTHVIHGVCHAVSSAKRFCMSSSAFTRSNLAVHWGSAFHSLLELAEACDVPVRWSDRASPARRRGHADAGIGEACLGGLDVVPTETRRLVLGSDHNGGVSRHSVLMIRGFDYGGRGGSADVGNWHTRRTDRNREGLRVGPGLQRTRLL